MSRRTLSPWYAESVRLLRELHRLIEEGKGDEAEADAIRDAMESPWREMSTEERRRVDDLSADLYALIEHPADSPPAPQEAWEALEQALQREDWENILELLREQPGLEIRWRRAYLRGKSWLELGEAETAARFLEDALRVRSVTGPPAPAQGAEAVGLRRRGAASRPRFPGLVYVERRDRP